MAEPPECQEHGSPGHNSQDVEVTYIPTSKCTEKENWPICAVEYNSAIKKKKEKKRERNSDNMEEARDHCVK